jgi:thiol:disulfide interchange protein DsbD
MTSHVAPRSIVSGSPTTQFRTTFIYIIREPVATLIALAAILGGAPAGARGQAREHPISFTVTAMTPAGTSSRAAGGASVAPGGRLTIALNTHIPPGWHLYSLTTPPGGPIASVIAVGPSRIARIAGAIDAPTPIVADDPNFGIVTETYTDSANFRIPVEIRPTTAAGTHALQVTAYYQTCNQRYCLPPVTDTLAVSVVVAAAAAVAPPAPGAQPVAEARPAVSIPRLVAQPPAGATGNPPTLIAERGATGSGSFALFLWLAATMGALSLLTPCVFPMVPVTISYFSRHEGGTRAAAVRDAVLYAGGITGAFTGLGLGLALIFGVAGLNRFAASAPLNLAIAALFIGFALSLFGVLHVALPSRIVNWLDGRARARNTGGVRRAASTVLMGTVFAITSFTCTAPFVGTLLVSASQGNWRWPAAGLLVFSSVFALPFLVLALVPQALSRLPRSGIWMVTLKGALGFAELAASLKFLSNADLVRGWGIFTRDVVIAGWVILGVALAVYLAGVRMRGALADIRRRAHPVAATLTLVATMWVGRGLTGRRLGELESFLPPAGRHASGVSGQGELAWALNDYESALAQARAEHKQVLIDFTGYTCTNCRWMEANMFPRADVRRALEPFVRVRLFTDGADERCRAQQAMEEAMFRTVALPLYAIVDTAGVPRATFLGMTRDANEFMRFLRGR